MPSAGQRERSPCSELTDPDDLVRENGILKHQLKNYVSAVQQLRHGSPHEILEQLQREQRGSEQQRHDDYHAEAQAYQHKLVQVTLLPAQTRTGDTAAGTDSYSDTAASTDSYR